jgi:hypothetical protein
MIMHVLKLLRTPIKLEARQLRAFRS